MSGGERAPAAGAQEPRFDTALLDLCREFGLTGAQFSAMLEAATAPATEPQEPAAWLVGTAVGPCPMLHYPEHFAATGWSVAPLYTRPAPQVAEPSGVERDREAMLRALEACEETLRLTHNATGKLDAEHAPKARHSTFAAWRMAWDVLEAAAAALAAAAPANPGGTHYDGCWREHHACAVALIERAQAGGVPPHLNAVFDFMEGRLDELPRAVPVIRRSPAFEAAVDDSARPVSEQDAEDEAWLEERLKVAAQDVARDASHLARARSNRMRATALRSLEYATSARDRWCRILARLRAGRDTAPASEAPR